MRSAERLFCTSTECKLMHGASIDWSVRILNDVISSSESNFLQDHQISGDEKAHSFATVSALISANTNH